MKTEKQISYTEILERLEEIFMTPYLMEDYLNGNGTCYESLGWGDLMMAPVNKLAFIECFGEEVMERAETEARKLIAEKSKHVRNRKEDGDDAEGAPYKGLHLKELDGGGVAVVGEGWRDTYFNRREIKAHGCTWDSRAKLWAATNPEDVERVRGWFALREASHASLSSAKNEMRA